MWRFKLLDLEKRILHWLQVKDFSPLWVKTCTLRLLALANFFSHCWHVKDFSPLWIRMWIFKVPFCVHLISHCLHLKCFSPLWLSKRLFRSPASMHLFSHWLQLAGSTMNEEIHLEVANIITLEITLITTERFFYHCGWVGVSSARQLLWIGIHRCYSWKAFSHYEWGDASLRSH